MKVLKTLIVVLVLLPSTIFASIYCNQEGVRLEVLGSGELALETSRSAESYLIWHNDRARVLVNPGPGTYLRYKLSGASFKDLLTIVVTQTGVEHTGDLLDILVASQRSERVEPLPVYGPTGNDKHPSMVELVSRLVSESGAYPELAAMLTHKNPAGYRLRVRDVSVPSSKPWAEFVMNQVHLSAIEVQSGDVPSLAWRADIEGTSLVFAGELSNQRYRIPSFAQGANGLVITHRLPVGARGSALQQYVTPEEIGRIAQRAGVQNLLLGGRGWRTFGRENATQEAIEENFDGPQIYANEEECWGF